MVLSAVRWPAATWLRKRPAHLCPRRGHLWCRNGGNGAAKPRPGRDMLPPYRAERVDLLARHGETAIKLSPILPDTMHHHGELARNRHLGAAHADTSGQCLAPAAQAAVGNLASGWHWRTDTDSCAAVRHHIWKYARHDQHRRIGI